MNKEPDQSPEGTTMAKSQQRLYGPKQIALITGSFLAGIGIFLFRRYREIGHIGGVEVIAAVITLFVTALIAVVIIRKGNKKE